MTSCSSRPCAVNPDRRRVIHEPRTPQGITPVARIQSLGLLRRACRPAEDLAGTDAALGGGGWGRGGGGVGWGWGGVWAGGGGGRGVGGGVGWGGWGWGGGGGVCVCVWLRWRVVVAVVVVVCVRVGGCGGLWGWFL